MELSTEAKPMQFGISALETALIAITGFGAMQKLPELAAALDVVVSGNPKIILEIGFGKGEGSFLKRSRRRKQRKMKSIML